MDNKEKQTDQELEFIGFVADQYDEILKGYNKLQKVEGFLQTKIESIRDQLNLSAHANNPEIWPYSLGKMLYFKLFPFGNNEKMQLKVRIQPTGWTVELWFIGQSVQLLETKGIIPVKTEIKFNESNVAFTTILIYDYTQDLDKIKIDIEQLVGKIYT